MAALIAAATTAIINSLGRIAAFLFSWAMVGFFGKMPPKRQYLLAGIGLMSMLWVVFFIGMFYPEAIHFLFLLNKGLNNPRVENTVQNFSIIIVLVLPFVIGLASLFVDSEPPATLGGKLLQVAKGWLIAPGFAVAMLLMMVTSVITIGITYLKRLKTEHVPITIKKGGYDIVMGDLRDALNKNGMPVREVELPIYLKPPVLVMTLLAKSIVQGLVTPGAKMLRGDNGLSIVVHPTDLVLAGPQTTALHARAIITQRVPFTEAYLTWEEAAQKFEDRITALWREWKDASKRSGGKSDMAARLRKIEELKGELHKTEIPFEQWEVVYRELLQLQDEVVSGRLERGQAPRGSDTSGAASRDVEDGARRSRGSAGDSTGSSSISPNSAFQEMAIAGLLLAVYAWWTNRRAGT
jgi:hypothetical protein